MPIFQRPTLPQPATVIVLNGASSSGKTTLARAMQATWGAPLHHIQLDAFRAMEPPGYWDGWEAKTQEATELMMGALCGAMHAAVAAYAKHGQQVVLDTALTNPSARHRLAEDLAGLPVYLVAVHCDADELARREAARRDRVVGLAASQVDWIHRRMQYDFEVDTTGRAPEEAAADLRRWLAGGPVAAAFDRLRVQLTSPSP